jgi:hypothetical protein
MLREVAAEVPMSALAGALPRHPRPGAGEHPRLPRRGRAAWSTARSPAPVAAPTRTAPLATSPARTWSTCSRARHVDRRGPRQARRAGRWLSALLGRASGSKVTAASTPA